MPLGVFLFCFFGRILTISHICRICSRQSYVFQKKFMKKRIIKYLISAFLLFAVFAFSSHYGQLDSFFHKSDEYKIVSAYFVIAFLFVLSFIVFYVSHVIKLPSFVFAIFFGIAAHPILTVITHEKEILGIIVGLGATLILFGGGLETPFENFKKIIWKIFSLSFVGLFLTAILFSFSVYTFSFLFNLPLSIMTSVLLGAILASTDPAAIIPVLKNLRFKNRNTKDIVISESAVTDVTGTLLTIVFLSLIVSNANFLKISDWYLAVFSQQSGVVLFKQLFYGIFFGIVGYLFLEFFMKVKKRFEQENEADSAFFLFVPIGIFALAVSFGGSGYLAAFICGLLFNLTEHLYETERFFNNIIDGFLKPTIFILLGSLINVDSLLEYAPLGIFSALVFMFIIRPLTVFISLAPFRFFEKNKLSWRELLFISSVRETGAIPAVLMMTVASLGLSEISGLVEVGMWVILMTLIIEPLLTPHIAKFLKVAKPIIDNKKINLNGSPTAVLVSRGKSFIERLPFATEWMSMHGIKKLYILLCLENKYSTALSAEIENLAKNEFQKMNVVQMEKDLPEIEFSFISRKGFLHSNIERISKENKNVSVIFVGKKMLDYRLNEIRNLAIPFYFLD
ncbi:MAG: Sodium/proton antiporter, CPA1 family [Candidatus Moranbacteria bacterium GW2011_GWF1_36_4]|nr:MAG: Sodium/proton antiporter, CPA1 family [Candidatus Moranbacteria bacterium GW2011_GWF1_36_4]KKQ28594.1 MAG: Sodium/proton antiporter, CPA1 family [Candidatus Moranbacteria bacterium GW2011_GWD1_37_17]KKQ47491.1 MAG: Sodium/proton antiporter, CPA1 family [Candidatus Moranbacteria bacterium GW2011_GWD2_37_9]